MPQGSSLDWTDDVIGRLKALWAEGHSTAEIGRRLGVSKNAIVGKAHRLELPARPSPIRSRAAGTAKLPRPKRQRVPPLRDLINAQKVSAPSRPIAAATPTPPPAAPQPAVSTPQRARVGNKTCCWPIGEPGRPGFHFCEDLALVGRPYCEAHCGDAYVRPRPRPDAHQH